MYRHSKENWVPDFIKRRPDVSMDTIEKIPAQPICGAARFPVQRVARLHRELPHADAGAARRRTRAPAATSIDVASLAPNAEITVFP